MSSAFKRKVYGKVRPVPKIKPKAPTRPSVSELRTIYRNIQKAPEWQVLDYLSEALDWWHKSLKWCAWKYKKVLPLPAAKAFGEAIDWLRKGQAAIGNKEKTACFIEVINRYQRYANSVMKTPAIVPFLKKSKEVTKKTVAVNKGLAVRFDKVLTLLSQCFKSCKIDLVVVAEIQDKVTNNLLPRKFDHEVGKMYYSRAHCNEMKGILHHQGLLALVIQEAQPLARGMSFITGNDLTGKFLANATEVHVSYIQLLEDFVSFARTKEAPKSLVRREKIAKKKVVKQSPLTRDRIKKAV